ncbi:uncharacterized protein [Phaseolus vulgaris]|uniref:uncharacterized protein n=1 Tax=Phaseolus vulgaris TaxID=3885 RepID=UPI0035CAE15A
MGFHSRWIVWIRGCLESTTIFVLVNGNPTSEFKPMRGLRHGDLLAAFLFLVVVEGLVGVVRQATKANLLKGVKVGSDEVDTYSYSDVFSLKAILRCYELAFGLKINFYKSKLTALEVVHSKIISIKRRFLWGWGREKSSILWVSWENLCKLLEEGGQGIKDIRKFNTTLLAKWKWRLLGEEKGKWKYIILSKYGIMHRHYQLPLKYQSWWWRDLCKSCDEDREEDWFRGALEWKVGGGDKIRFWEDAWCGGGSHLSKYPRMYSLSLDQGKKVAKVGGWEDSEWRWRLGWRRAMFLLEIPHRLEIGTIYCI